MTNQTGITLLEVLVSMLIIGAGLFGLAPLLVLSVDTNSTSDDMLKAAALAKETMERYSIADSIPASLPFNETESSLGAGYTRITTIYDNSSDTTLPTDVCNIEVAISWTDNANKQRVTTFTNTIVR